MDWQTLNDQIGAPFMFSIASTTASTTDYFAYDPPGSGVYLLSFNQLFFWLFFCTGLILFTQWVSIMIKIFKK